MNVAAVQNEFGTKSAVSLITQTELHKVPGIQDPTQPICFFRPTGETGGLGYPLKGPSNSHNEVGNDSCFCQDCKDPASWLGDLTQQL